jgi:hypothetical protein
LVVIVSCLVKQAPERRGGNISEEGYRTAEAFKSKPTKRMKDYLNKVLSKKEAKLCNLYEYSKQGVKNSRQALQANCSEEEAAKLLDNITSLERDLVKSFESIRHCSVRGLERILIRKADVHISLTRYITTVLNKRIAGLEDTETDLANYKLIKKSTFSKFMFNDLSQATSTLDEHPQ